MDWNFKKNRNYLLAIVVLCALIPHAVLTILSSQAIAERMAPVVADSYGNFFVREWIPFWAVFISYLRLQKLDVFSPLPLVVTALIVPTFIPRNEQNGVLVLSLTLLMLLVMECFALLKKLEYSGNKVLSGMAADRKMLRGFFFWSVGILCIAHIACAGTNAKILPFLLLPIPGVLLYSTFRRGKEQPPTPGGMIGMVIMMLASLPLAIFGPMEFFRLYHLTILLIGYALILLLLTVYHMDHWRKPKNKN